MKFEGTFDSICPITRVAVGEIVHPVGIRGFPQHAYEMDALAVWVRRSGSDPLTRKAMLLSSVVALEMAGRDSEKTQKALKLLQHEMNVYQNLEYKYYEKHFVFRHWKWQQKDWS